MDISIRRWQKLSGILNESAEVVSAEGERAYTEATCESHGMMNCGECSENDAQVEEAVQNSLDKLLAARELESNWSSGNVFGKKSNSRAGSVTLGFPGIGFKN
jgi:hypothetical protein